MDVDPTDLKPGDVVIALSGHELSGGHCDVRGAVERPAGQEPAVVKNQEVWVITTPEGKTLVRTDANAAWYENEPGYAITRGEMTWKAARAVSRAYARATGGTRP